MKPTLHKIIDNVEYKLCSKCKQYKDILFFNKESNAWDKLYPSCKDCKKLGRNYVPKKEKDKMIDNINNRLCSYCELWKDKTLFVEGSRKCLDCKRKSNILYYENNKEILSNNNAIYRKNHKDELYAKHKIWIENNKEYTAEYQKEYRKNNKEKLLDYDREKHHRYKKNAHYRIVKNMRRRVLDAIKGNPKASTTFNLVGCSIDALKTHLEKLFQPGMNWDNYGQWHIDHIIPCASFDLSNKDEQIKCFHYTNMQPLWKSDNLKKGKKTY